MYEASQAFKKALKNKTHRFKISGTIGSRSFTDENILKNSLSINNQSTNTDDVTIGSVFIGEFKATFVNFSEDRGYWKNKKITVNLSLLTDNGWESIPMGVFKVSDAEKNDFGISVTAYDMMCKFDKRLSLNNLSGTAYDLLALACDRCKVPFGMTQNDFHDLPNGNVLLNLYGEGENENKSDVETYRDLIFWVTQVVGGFATMNRYGELVIKSYQDTYVDVIDDEHRLKGGTWSDYVTHYTGIYCGNMDGTESYYGYDPDEVEAEILRLEADLDGLTDDYSEGMTELTQLESDLTGKKAEKTALQNQYKNGEIDEETYLSRLSVINQQISRITAEIGFKKDELSQIKAQMNSITARINWLSNQFTDEGVAMDLGDNPLIQYKTTAKTDSIRKTMLRTLDKIAYTPFECSSILNVLYDLGDVVLFSGGVADDALCCVMAYDFSDDGKMELKGFGTDPAIAAVRSKEQKGIRAGQKNTSENHETRYYIFTNSTDLEFRTAQEVIRVNFLMGKRSQLVFNLEIPITVNCDYETSENYIDISDTTLKTSYFLDDTDMDRDTQSSYGGGKHLLSLVYGIDTIDPGIHNFSLKIKPSGGVVRIKRGEIYGMISGIGLETDIWNGMIEADDNVSQIHFIPVSVGDAAQAGNVSVANATRGEEVLRFRFGHFAGFTENVERS